MPDDHSSPKRSPYTDALKMLALRAKKAATEKAALEWKEKGSWGLSPRDARSEKEITAAYQSAAHKRADNYLPLAGREHCPDCWVVDRFEAPLAIDVTTKDGAVEKVTATCARCALNEVLITNASST